MTQQSNKTLEKVVINQSVNYSHSDIWVGLLLVMLGSSATWMANSFDAVSRSYPLVLSVMLALLGVTIIVNVFLNKGKHVSFALPSRIVASAGLVIALWILAFSNGLGFLFPTFLMQFFFLLFCGVRSLLKAVAFSVLISGVSYLVFIVLLKVRLPETLASWLL